MIIHSEQEMITHGRHLSQYLVLPSTVELIGDIGAGKTTLVKGIAQGLGITTDITSPSFVISKTYHSQTKPITLTHFDFYRLADPGIMREQLAESINDPHTITIIEWASTVKNLLPKNHTTITVTYNDDNTRTIKVKK